MSRIAVVSVAVSVAVMLVALAVILGFKREVTARMVGFSAPVEVIDGAGIYAAESRPVAATARFEALLRAVDGVQRATPMPSRAGSCARAMPWRAWRSKGGRLPTTGRFSPAGSPKGGCRA